MSYNVSRVTSLMSGLDTDQLVKDLMKAENIKVDRIKQDKIYTEWQQESYRDIINSLRSFKDEFFDYANPDTNLRSTSSFIAYESNMKNEDDNWYVDVNVGSASVTGNYTITDIALAKGAVKEGNNVDVNSTLADLGYADGVEFTIETTNSNGETKNETIAIADSSTKLKDVFSEVNSRDLGINMYYDEIKNKVIVKSEETGAGFKINNITDTGDFGTLISDLGLTTVDADDVTGADAKVTFKDENGVSTDVYSSTNSLTVNGLTLDLKQNITSGSIDFSVSTNSENIIDKIKGFVDKYNELIDDINTKLTEERYYDFDPLTDEQKKELTEEEVKQWEEKAKSGILRSDSTLQSLVRNMRSVLYESVDGVGLYNIGITTSSSITDKGKLIIDEDKLKEAIEDNPSEVANLFSKEEEGLANKLYDILEDNITTKTDSNGRKGILLEKAGIEGDRTVNENMLSKKIDDYEDKIVDLIDELNQKENYYYLMFAKMERALGEMNAQSSFFTGQMG